MKLLLFTLFDACAEYYHNPVYARTRAEAIRSLVLAVSDPSTQYAQHAEHFTLFELGTFEPLTAKLELHQAPVHVINAWELKPQAYVPLKAVAD